MNPENQNLSHSPHPENLEIVHRRPQQSSSPSLPPQLNHTIIIQHAPQASANSWGVAGFVFAMTGLISCGLTSFIGLPLSLIGLFKAPRGLAISGSIVNSAIVSLVVFALLPFIATAGGIAAACVGLLALIGIGSDAVVAKDKTDHVIKDAVTRIETWKNENRTTLFPETADDLIRGMIDA